MAIKNKRVIDSALHDWKVDIAESLEATVAAGYKEGATAISQLAETDQAEARSRLDDMVAGAEKSAEQLATYLVEAILEEIRTYAEIEVPVGDLQVESASVRTTVPSGTFSQGAGTAAVPNPSPVPLNGKLQSIKVGGTITKGHIK